MIIPFYSFYCNVELNLIFYCNVEKDLVYFSWPCSVEQQEEGDQKTPEKNNTLHFYLSESLCQLKELLLEDLFYFSASYLSTSQFILISTAFFFLFFSHSHLFITITFSFLLQLHSLLLLFLCVDHPC